MARRRQNETQGILGLAALAAGGWLLIQCGRIISANGATVAAALAIIVVATACFIFLRKWLAARRQERLQQSLLKKVYVATQNHLQTLARKRMQLVQPDDYGNQKFEKWNDHIKYFLFEHLGPSFSPDERSILPQNFAALALTIDNAAKTAMRDHPSFLTFSDDMSPTQFESFCAQELREAGWNARVTLQSRDQGVDVVAEKSGVRVVLQCKLYTGPVGNKAVQEIAAGRTHERADHGIVVTNNRYTSAAEQLAATNGVLLTHYRDLRNLDGILPQPIADRPPTIVAGRREPFLGSSVPLPAPGLDRARWDALLSRDPQIGIIADKLRTALGQKWVDKFAASYMAENDRNKLPTLVTKIIADARKEIELGKLHISTE